MQIRSRIAPCLWFDNQAEEAAKFYTGIFRNSKIVATSRYGEAGKEVHEQAQQCGWLKDRFGVSWQVVRRVLPELLMDADPAKSARAMQALLNMKKLDIAALQPAFNANPS